MSERNVREVLRDHRRLEIGVAVGVTATAGVLAATKLIRSRRQTARPPSFEIDKVHETKIRQRRSRDDTIRYDQDDFYRQQLSIFQDGELRPRTQALLLQIALEVHKATHHDQAGSISFANLHDRLETRKRLLDKSLGRLEERGIISYREEEPVAGHVAGYIDTGVLLWMERYGQEADMPGFLDVVNQRTDPEVMGEGYYGEE